MPTSVVTSQGQEMADDELPDSSAKTSRGVDAENDVSSAEDASQQSEFGVKPTAYQTPMITPSILSSIPTEHILHLITPLLSDSSEIDDKSSKEALAASIANLLDSNKLTPEKFWEKTLLHIPWAALQDDAYAVMRTRKLQLIEKKRKTALKKMPVTRNPKKIKEPIVLPPPANPPHYTKVEAVRILAQYKPASVIIKRMIDQNMVPCSKTQLYSVMKIGKDGGDLTTPWTKEKSEKKPEKVTELPLELPTPSNPPFYSETEVMNLMSTLPTVTNPPYYTKAQTAALLLKCGSHEKAMMDKLIEQKLVPVVTKQQLRNLLKKAKSGEADLTKHWNTKRAVDDNGEKKPRAKKRTAASEIEQQPNKKRSKQSEGMPKAKEMPEKGRAGVQNICEAFVSGAKTLDDADFVRHVALEFERRGYTFGLKLGKLNADTDVKDKKKNVDRGAAAGDTCVTMAKELEPQNNGETAKQRENGEEKATASSKNEQSRMPNQKDAKKVAEFPDGPVAGSVARLPALPLGILFYPSTSKPQASNMKRWGEMYTQAKAFYEEHGHLRVKEKALSKWLSRQKNQWKEMLKEGVHHSMTTKKIVELNAINLGKFSAFQVANNVDKQTGITDDQIKREAKKEKLWNDRLNELKAFKEANGTTVVPRHINDVLSKWAYKQRVEIKKFRDGDISAFMTQEKIDKLAEIGFDTTNESKAVRQEQRRRLKTKSDVKWEQNFNALVEYKEKFGTCDLKEKKGDHEYKKLASWCGLQRTKYKKKNSGQSVGRSYEITDEQIKRLAGIGFNFAGKRLDFDARFRQLLEFVKEFGHTRVPVFYAEHDNLGRWAKRMRDGIRMNEPWVNEIHKARLLGIGFDIEARQVFDHPWKKDEQLQDDLVGLNFEPNE